MKDDSNEDLPASSGRRDFVAKGSLLSAAAAILSSLPVTGFAVGASKSSAPGGAMNVDLILFNGNFHTVDQEKPRASAVAIGGGKFVAVGSDAEIMALRSNTTQVIDLHKRTMIPGLNDSHLHLIRGGLNYNLELRWEGVPSLADGLRMLKDQADRTPTPQWVRVVGGWNEFQFAEKRLPTLEELNQAAPDTPVFKQGGHYLITGGYGGIGLTIAGYLMREYGAKISLISREGLPPRAVGARAGHGAISREMLNTIQRSADPDVLVALCRDRRRVVVHEAVLRLATLSREAKRNYDRLLRTAADFENFKKRAKRDRAEAVQRMSEALAATKIEGVKTNIGLHQR